MFAFKYSLQPPINIKGKSSRGNTHPGHVNEPGVEIIEVKNIMQETPACSVISFLKINLHQAPGKDMLLIIPFDKLMSE